jgi:hypothetical protein
LQIRLFAQNLHYHNDDKDHSNRCSRVRLPFGLPFQIEYSKTWSDEHETDGWTRRMLIVARRISRDGTRSLLEGCKVGTNSRILFEKSSILTGKEDTMDRMGLPKFRKKSSSRSREKPPKPSKTGKSDIVIHSRM